MPHTPRVVSSIITLAGSAGVAWIRGLLHPDTVPLDRRAINLDPPGIVLAVANVFG